MSNSSNNRAIKYFPKDIEPKWQKRWEEDQMYMALDFDKKPKFYTLIEFPYPSGAGLHVGHTRSWSAMDAYSRKKRMGGFNVLYPIGWDAFGLPAENYAIKMKIHPQIVVQENIANFKRQIKSLGLSFDWSREIDTTDPKYYKWTQWIFLQFLKKGLAYQADVPVNWCPFCKTNLADEEVCPNGTHERCGTVTEKRMQKQWLLKITEYAQKLLDDLNKVDYPNKIRVQQENWIGKSEGVEINFSLIESDTVIPVFTTRPDTIFGATGLVLAPEHPLVLQILDSKFNIKDSELNNVRKYVKESKRKSELERTSLDKAKTGVFTGLFVKNPLSKENVPVWVGDYVVGWYGKGAVMVVPAHDQRDYEFAKKYELPIVEVVKGGDISQGPYEGEGELISSGEFTGQSSKEAKRNITKHIEEHHLGKAMIQFKLRDWVFSRQHYWGEPIPVIHCKECGTVAVPEKDLPVELPYLEEYEPSGTGESPLAKATDWVNVQCPICKEPAKRETDTMPNWAGSNWYFLRYLNPQNDEALADKRKMEYWMPVDVYQGGFEHTTLHLLYSRFVYKFLFEIGVVPSSEPYAKRRVHGIVLGPDGKKMSKSFGNVINPDDIVKTYGADTLRVYEMFMGPFDQTIAWNEEGVEGCFRFLKRIWQLSHSNVSSATTSRSLLACLNQTIKKVGDDIEAFKFNTAVASMMQFINDWQADKNGLSKDDLKKFLLVLAPFAPHITEEVWHSFRESDSIHNQAWPSYDSSLLVSDEVTIVVQVNGKVRDNIRHQTSKVKDQKEIESKARDSEKVKPYLEGKKIKKVIYVEGKIINFAVE